MVAWNASRIKAEGDLQRTAGQESAGVLLMPSYFPGLSLSSGTVSQGDRTQQALALKLGDVGARQGPNGHWLGDYEQAHCPSWFQLPSV